MINRLWKNPSTSTTAWSADRAAFGARPSPLRWRIRAPAGHAVIQYVDEPLCDQQIRFSCQPPSTVHSLINLRAVHATLHFTRFFQFDWETVRWWSWDCSCRYSRQTDAPAAANQPESAPPPTELKTKNSCWPIHLSISRIPEQQIESGAVLTGVGLADEHEEGVVTVARGLVVGHLSGCQAPDRAVLPTWVTYVDGQVFTHAEDLHADII